MRVKYSPIRSDDTITHEFENDVVTITIGNETDIFDFTSFADGEAVVSEFETTLPLNPFVSVKRENGELFIEVINYISANATYEERFPKWQVIDSGND